MRHYLPDAPILLVGTQYFAILQAIPAISHLLALFAGTKGDGGRSACVDEGWVDMDEVGYMKENDLLFQEFLA